MKSKAKILIVDDDADFVEATRIILESKPYEVIVAVNGEEALRKPSSPLTATITS